MGIEATDIYCRHTDEHDFEMAALKNEERCPIGSRHMIVHRTPDHSKAINKLNGPLVIISASGVATGGGVLHHLKQRLPDPSNTVLLSGPSARHARPSAARRRKRDQAVRPSHARAGANKTARRLFGSCRPSRDPPLAPHFQKAAAKNLHRSWRARCFPGLGGDHRQTAQVVRRGRELNREISLA